MNQDQLNSSIRSLLKIIGVIIVMFHVPNAQSWTDLLNLPDVFGLLSTLAGLWLSHQAHATPPTSSTPPTAGTGGSSAARLPMFLAFACMTFVCFSGCAPLQPGADPIVVNVERTETVGQSTFNLILNVDNTDRAFWATNVPAFHNFCEWLRQPQTIEATNTLPRALAMLLSLDDVKIDYEAGRSSSNAVLTALATLQGVVDQAVSWSTIITNQPAHAP